MHISHAAKEWLLLLRTVVIKRRYWNRVCYMIVAKALVISFAMLLPLLMQYLIDHVIPKRDWHGYWVFILITAIVLSLSVTVGMGGDYLGTRVGTQVTYDLARRVLARLDRMQLRQIEAYGVGEHIYHMTGDVGNIANAIVYTLPNVFLSLIQCMIFLGISLHINKSLTAMFVLSIPMLLVTEVWHAKQIAPINKKVLKQASVIQNAVGQYINGIASMRLYQAERTIRRRVVSQFGEQVRCTMHQWRVNRLFQILAWLNTTGFGWLIVIYGIALVMRGELTLGSLIAMKMYLSSASRPLENLVGMTQSLVTAAVSFNRITMPNISDTTPKANAANPKLPRRAVAQVPASIAFHGVTFSYDNQATLLSNVMLSCPAGSLYGITGPSGSGKSTIVSLLTRLLDPEAGRILLDDINIHDLSVADLRRQISVAPQDVFLFSGSVADNISCGNSAGARDDIIRAAVQADAHRFVMGLSEGYNTSIGEGGQSLSLGQRQRIGIARSLLRRSRILVLDESLNSLDRPSRERILDTLRREKTARTIVVITHDLDVLAMCDRVSVLAGGSVVREGPFAMVRQSDEFIRYLTAKKIYESERMVDTLTVANRRGVNA